MVIIKESDNMSFQPCMIKNCSERGTICVAGMWFCVHHITEINQGLKALATMFE